MINKRMQNGAALAIGLILMAVATLVSVTAMHIAGTEERVAANQREVAVAFMAAETGLAQGISWLEAGNNAQTCWSLTSAQCQSLINGLDRDVSGDFEATWTILVRLNSAETAELISTGATATGTNRIVRVLYTRPTDPRPSPAFLVGLISETDITVNGASVFRGGAHANGNFTNSSGGSSLIGATITASGTATYGGSGGPALSNQTRIPVPSARSYIFGETDANGRLAGNGAKDALDVVNSCAIPPNGDLLGKTYFCNDNLTVSGGQEVKNGTLLVAGNVTWNGSAKLGTSDELTLGVFATGVITLNGASDSYAVWWADGEGGRGQALDGVVQNGSSVLGGAVVSRKRIIRNGEFNFIQASDFGNIDLPIVPGLPSDASGWRELKSI